mmetsp:Transcript_24657/g.39439  ORF Transcript_24657/g.39439 Transcript_24657/m.39439 type:complete len:488 (+) Transcript_24657:142-1605(+)
MVQTLARELEDPARVEKSSGTTEKTTSSFKMAESLASASSTSIASSMASVSLVSSSASVSSAASTATFSYSTKGASFEADSCVDEDIQLQQPGSVYRLKGEDGESESGGPPRVGITFSERFMLHSSPRKGHEERPARIESIQRELQRVNLWEQAVHIEPREASDEELRAVHTKGYIRKLARLEEKCKRGSPEERSEVCTNFTMDHEDVYMNEHTIGCARLAAGACMQALQAIHEKQIDCGVAIVRPPGHHAEAHCAQGFCIFNNVAIAAKHAVDTLGIKRVLIVDWDVHHGNGTQHAFYNDPRVLYFSIHRFDFGRYYPALEAAGPMATGKGLAAGTNVNVAWNGHGFGDAEYLTAWQSVLMPIAQDFDPELVIVSAGFDAAQGDRMGRCNITPMGYAAMTRELLKLANGKILLVLEGGYDLSSLSKSLAACIEELFHPSDSESHNSRVSDIVKQYVRPEALEAIQASICAHTPYWKSLCTNSLKSA